MKARRVDPRSIAAWQRYDIHGRLSSQKTEKSGAEAVEISYTYDDNGNQLEVTDKIGTTARTYDELNSLGKQNVVVTKPMLRK